MRVEVASSYRHTDWIDRIRKSLGWFRRNVVFVASLVVILLVVCIAVLAPFVSGQEPTTQNLSMRLRPPSFLPGGDPAHPLGTDHLGRDVWSRLVYGSRISLLVALASVGGGGVLGISLGLVSGYFRGYTDTVIMALVDAMLAMPFVLLAVAVVTVIGGGMLNTVMVLIMTGWVVYARVVRSIVLSVREREFVLAARAVGADSLRIIAAHVLPNTVNEIVVIVALQVAEMIIAEAALSFMGLGIQPPMPSWGNMIADGRGYITSAWWVVTLPGLAITITVLAINFFGDWLRRSLDPRSRRVVGF
jgi:peptide/nickel transport system permease protein